MSMAVTDNALMVHDFVEDVDDEDVRSTDDGDDVGSLVDFIVDDEGEGEECNGDETESVLSDPPETEDDQRVRELDGMDSSNIITGKRTRRQTKFYEHEVFSTDEYRKMVLDDVPEEERHALEDSSDEEEGSDDDENYESDDAVGEDSEGEDDAPSESSPTKKQKE
jgi:hypothetical protein